MYVDYDKLLPRVVQILIKEGVNEDSFNRNRALYAIKESYRDFVQETNLIRRTFDVPTQSNVNQYQLFKVDGYVVNRIYSIKMEHACDVWKCLERSSICSCNCCRDTYNYNDGMLSVCPAPECDGLKMRICASVFPEDDTCQMEERIYEMYGKYIAAGAASMLLGGILGETYKQKFAIGIDLAGSAAADQWSRNSTKPRRQGWRRR